MLTVNEPDPVFRCAQIPRRSSCCDITWPASTLYANPGSLPINATVLDLHRWCEYVWKCLLYEVLMTWWLSMERLPVTETQTQWPVGPEQHQQLHPATQGFAS